MRSILLSLASLAALALAACTNSVEPASTVDPKYNFDEEYFLTSTDTVVSGSVQNVTFSSASIGGKLNFKSTNKIPSGSTFGVLVSASSTEPTFGADGVLEFRCKTKSLIYSCQASGLQMGTTYYYRAYFKDGNNARVRLGRVFAFTTEQCSVETLAPSAVGFCSATVQGRSSIKLNRSSFSGSFGVLYTGRQTDRPNAKVDKFAAGSVAAGDSVVFDVQLSALSPATKYVYQAYLKIDTTYYYGPVKSFTTNTLTISDSELPVDLGLSVRWASRNVGAENAALAGTYFPYGDPTGEMLSSDYNDYPNTDIIGSQEYDMATVNLGVGWQLPSQEQFKELVDDCDWMWTTFRNVQGYAVMSKVNRNAIFLPACGYTVPSSDGRTLTGADISEPVGYYWSGNRANFARSAYSLSISISSVSCYNLGDKTYGFPVRPVAE